MDTYQKMLRIKKKSTYIIHYLDPAKGNYQSMFVQILMYTSTKHRS